MVDRDLILTKLDSIQRCLKRIESKTKGDPKSLESLDVQDIFVLNLQRAIQTAIDISGHIAASKNLGIPKTLKEPFELLKDAQIIPGFLAKKLSKMVGFRNIAVHEYRVISQDILESILTEHLQDLREFVKVIGKLL